MALRAPRDLYGLKLGALWHDGAWHVWEGIAFTETGKHESPAILRKYLFESDTHKPQRPSHSSSLL